MRRAFHARGHNVISVDLLPAEDGAQFAYDERRQGAHWQGDARVFFRIVRPPESFDLLIAHPECTRLTNAGRRWLHHPPPGRTLSDMWTDFDAACDFYLWVRSLPIHRKCIENPVMHDYARRRLGFMNDDISRQLVQPWHFGDPFFKATGLELHNLPFLRDTNRLIPPKPGTTAHKQWSAVHRANPGPNRWKDRSRTFPGIAEAMATQWNNA